MIDTLLFPFQLDFMVTAMVMAVLVTIPAALLSGLLVLRGWALMGDAISHAVLPGVIAASLGGLPVALGAFAAGMSAAVAIGWLDANSRVKRDTIMGIVFSGMFALGLVLFTMFGGDQHLFHLLFGDLLGVGWDQIWRTALLLGPVAVAVALLRKDLLLTAFDPTHAQALGMRVGAYYYGLLAAISLTVIGAMQAVGLILAIGILIAPGATAFLVTRRFGAMLVVASLLGAFCAVAGVYLSFWIDSAPAPTIVLCMTAVFLVTLFAKMVRQRRQTALMG